MTSRDIEQQVITLVRTVKKNVPADAVIHTTLLADAGIDSLDALSILFAIEDHFGIVISDERARAIRTFGDVIETVAALVPARP